MTRKSSRVVTKQVSASRTFCTIGSALLLNDVFSSSGVPVSSPNVRTRRATFAEQVSALAAIGAPNPNYRTRRTSLPQSFLS
jgi:hypothetical protein